MLFVVKDLDTGRLSVDSYGFRFHRNFFHNKHFRFVSIWDLMCDLDSLFSYIATLLHLLTIRRLVQSTYIVFLFENMFVHVCFKRYNFIFNVFHHYLIVDFIFDKTYFHLLPTD